MFLNLSQIFDKILKMAEHTSEQQIDCALCSDSFRDEDSLKNHMFDHIDVPSYSMVSCSLCEKEFISNSRLQNHMYSHAKVKQFACETCGKTFARKCHLEEHMFTHTGEKPHTCEVCGRCFAFRRHVTKHMLTHVKPHECAECHKKFSHKAQLDDHMYNHIGIKPFQCGTCGRGFIRERGLKDHMLSHMKRREYKCKKCTRTFANMETLQDHMSLHRQTVKYKCDKCGGIYKNENSLRGHKKTHMVEKGHKCYKCGKTFPGKVLFNAHICEDDSKAEIDKTFRCQFCSRPFKTVQALIRHKILSHSTGSTRCNRKKETKRYTNRQFKAGQALRRHNILSCSTGFSRCKLCDKGCKLKHSHIYSKIPHIKETKRYTREDDLQDEDGVTLELSCTDEGYTTEDIKPRRLKPRKIQPTPKMIQPTKKSERLRLKAENKKSTLKHKTVGANNAKSLRIAENKSKYVVSSSMLQSRFPPVSNTTNTSLVTIGTQTVRKSHKNSRLGRTETSVDFVEDADFSDGDSDISDMLDDDLNGEGESVKLSAGHEGGIVTIIPCDEPETDIAEVRTEVFRNIKHIDKIKTGDETVILMIKEDSVSEDTKYIDTSSEIKEDTRSQAENTRSQIDSAKLQSVRAKTEPVSTSEQTVKKGRLTCEICNKTLKNEKSFKNHFLVHDDRRPFGCDICGRKFKRGCHLRDHKQIHERSDMRTFICDICDKIFVSLDTLKRHKKIHSPEKPYKCEVCSKGFHRNCHLKSHLNTHSDMRDYVRCEICKKLFMHVQSLKKHLQTHAPMKKNKCHLCPKYFTSAYNLQRHIVSQHKVLTEHRQNNDQGIDSIGMEDPSKANCVESVKEESSLELCDGHTEQANWSCSTCNSSSPIQYADQANHADTQIKELESLIESVPETENRLLDNSLSDFRHVSSDDSCTRPFRSNENSPDRIQTQDLRDGESGNVSEGADRIQTQDLRDGESGNVSEGADRIQTQDLRDGESGNVSDGVVVNQNEVVDNDHMFTATMIPNINDSDQLLMDTVSVVEIETNSTVADIVDQSEMDQIVIEARTTNAKNKGISLRKIMGEPVKGMTKTRRKEGEKSLICEYCGLCVTTHDSLRRHLNRLHLEFPTFPCDICGKKFAREEHLAAHRNAHLKLISSKMSQII